MDLKKIPKQINAAINKRMDSMMIAFYQIRNQFANDHLIQVLHRDEMSVANYSSH